MTDEQTGPRDGSEFILHGSALYFAFCSSAKGTGTIGALMEKSVTPQRTYVAQHEDGHVFRRVR